MLNYIIYYFLKDFLRHKMLSFRCRFVGDHPGSNLRLDPVQIRIATIQKRIHNPVYYRKIKNNHRLLKKIPALFNLFISTKSDGFCNGRCFLKVRARRPFCEHNPPPPPDPIVTEAKRSPCRRMPSHSFVT